MPRSSIVSPESFEEILTWLHPDREVAGAMYVQLRHDLAKIFKWRGCSDPEGLTDEVFDRVAKKVRDVRPGYQGDPRLYFRAVANKLIKEDFKKIKTYASLEDVDLSKQQTTRSEPEEANIHKCLESCLQELSTDKRELILSYYAKEKQAKIDHRRDLAQQLGISVETLRVRVYRIGESLGECIERCLKQKMRQK